MREVGRADAISAVIRWSSRKFFSAAVKLDFLGGFRLVSQGSNPGFAVIE